MSSGTKRSFGELDSQDTGPPAPAATNEARPNSKRQKYSGNGKHKAKEGSLEWAKKRVRNIERLFQRNQDMPANVRNDMERELVAHKATVADKSFHTKRSSMISKYHMVRFFERKKAARLAKQLKRQMEESTDADETLRLKLQLHKAEVDEIYTQFFPHIENYISLYSNAKSGDAGNDTKKTPIAKGAIDAERPAIWYAIETAMDKGPEALRKIRERRSPDESDNAAQKSRAATKKPIARPNMAHKQQTPASKAPAAVKGQNDGMPQPNRRERRKLMRETGATQNADDDDDGGFFEDL